MADPISFKTAVEQEIRRLEAIHPTPNDIPGCMSILDDFLSCNALGFQLKSVYRYGRQSECGRKLEDFKFCLSLKSLDEDARREAWIRRRAEWWAARRTGKSCEDVWTVRTSPPPNFPPEGLLKQLSDSQKLS
ncbi:hypothetical protein PNOK_0291900 [Pyrrhoderma noxium]|uniref:Uncharacterized protein n=1 Tax=Pyrrhoderma noxium TaxID=2282107 RepID=A0A286UL47_9AGAM|nr:hypothetical protein PNOK_0291900 [Pyrrhoderma noxium]